MSTIQVALNELLELDGAMAAAVVDSESGMMLGQAGSGLDLELAAASITEVVRAKLRIMKLLNLQDKLEDILITLSTQYHIIRPVSKVDGIFIFYVLNHQKANLALARRRLHDVEEHINI